jgi:sulfur relay (sulfurtransferase) complex TusBCD TusD component (DsrE family)
MPRGLADADLVEGAGRSTMNELADVTATAEKVLAL